ncbi:hypothetical protein Ddye_015628 [Dipteronia dyeriana]|uniref:Uncharacterized protein n=1 Tax=Dipteronia dyeriana TaxID=168575 RepID=A0AAD9U682_9ROSI|nr:hypothetical protein Ddye_015628 [Dipteronia dyeriana]
MVGPMGGGGEDVPIVGGGVVDGPIGGIVGFIEGAGADIIGGGGLVDGPIDPIGGIGGVIEVGGVDVIGGGEETGGGVMVVGRGAADIGPGDDMGP